MKLLKITVHYNVKRVSHYQSAEVGAAIEIELQIGDKEEEAFKQAMQTLTPLIDAEAETAIKHQVYLDSQGGR